MDDVTPNVPPVTPPAPPAAPAEFDVTTLSPEALAFIEKEKDRARTQASETARKNALEKAKNDPEIEKVIRERIEAEARMTEEDKWKAKMDEVAREKAQLDLKDNRFDAKSLLIEKGVPAGDIDYYCDLLVTANKEETHKRVEDFVAKFTASIDNVAEVIKKDIHGNTPKPSGNVPESTQASLEGRLATAVKNGDSVSVVQIVREAAEQGIILPNF